MAMNMQNINKIYTTLTNSITKYNAMCKVLTIVGGIN